MKDDTIIIECKSFDFEHASAKNVDVIKITERKKAS